MSALSRPTQRSFWLRHRPHLALGYLVLLVGSWIHNALTPLPSPPPTPRSSPYPYPIVLLEDPLHASAACLPSEAPFFRPVLPGLNAPRQKTDPSFERLANSLPPVLPTSPFVLIANGHAGAVALHYTAAHPENVAGLVLLDASGVQELSLLGEYHLNYALYAISDITLRIFDWTLPHFGLWKNLAVRRGQTGLLLHSDRRLLRPLFQQILPPTLILRHRDNLLADSAADEHQRLLPQSLSEHIDSPRELPPLLHNFLASLGSPETPHRDLAAPQRLADARRDFNPRDRPRPHGWPLVGVLLALALATVFTEDLTCAITGLMIANGNLTWAQGIGACLGGILLYDYQIYVAGRLWGRPALGKIPLRWMIDPADLRETEEWFSHRTGGAMLITRFIPGTRGPAYLAAGILGVPWKSFTFWFVLASVVWTPLVIGLSALLAGRALAWMDRFAHTAPALLLAAAALYFLLTHILLPACNRRGRRKLYGRWKRLTSSEFWPSSLLYFPVFLFLLLRTFRRGNRFLDFTACNPSIPASGFIDESKSGILDQIADRSAVAPYLLLPATLAPEERLSRALAFVSGYPVVLKPDAGQRGERVVIARDEARLRRALANAVGDHLIQAYVPGLEFGVFFVRPPGREEGFLLSITRKTFPGIVGDGLQNVEDLLLAHPRAVCQARVLFHQHRERLYDIPAAGERIPLTDVGNHARGALFEDATPLATPALTHRINAVCRSFPGFHFGRFDIRVPTLEDFQAGRALSILELNGLTSESTSLYDPGYSYIRRVAVLVRQWGWACRIGRHNRENGTPLTPFRRLLADYDRHHKLRTAAKLKALEG